MAWIPEHRPRLVQAGLTVLRAYIAAGQPRQPYPPMGSFEDWDQMVRRPLTWLGEADPLAGTAELNDADPVRRKLRALLAAWWTTFRTAGATSKEAVTRAQETQRDAQGDEERPAQALWDVLSEHFTDRRGKIRSQLIGEFIRKYARRVEVGARFENYGTNQDRQLWRVVVVDDKRFQEILASGLQGDKGDRVTEPPMSPCHPCHPYPPSPENYGAAVSLSPLAIRIVEILQATGFGGMTPDDLTRMVDAGKTGPALVKATINQLLLTGRIGRTNDRLVFNPQPDQSH